MNAPEPGAQRLSKGVAGIVLAAGRSSRFGGDVPKQLYPIRGEAMVRRTARVALASRLDRVVVVAGHRAIEVGAAVADLALEVVVNPDFARGQSTSVRAGLAKVCSEAEVDAAVFIPCDLPDLDAAVIDRLLAAHADSTGLIVVPTVEGRRRAPVLIDRALFGEIRGITGDRGARQLFAAHEPDLVEVAFESARLFEDLDRLVDGSASP
jgi:molybdenum cofactor cytidylyltransferase